MRDLLAVGKPASAGDGQVEQVRGVVALGGQVARVRLGQVHAGADLLGDGHAQDVELRRLVRVVGQQPDAVGPDGGQHLRGGGVVALVLAVAVGQVGLVGV